MIRNALVGLSFFALLTACRSMDGGVEVISNAACPISGQPVADAYYDYDGHKIYTCCEKCVAKVKANPSAAMAKAYPGK